MINGTTKLMGLIGNPVAHTLSPVIHNTIAKQLEINMVYVPFPVSEDLQGAINGASRLKIEGMNVTVPYKTEIIPFLQDVDEKAMLIGAVNTLVPYNHGYKGYNTDYMGLYQALLSENIDIHGQKVIIIGAGGSARAAAFLCAWKQAKSVIIANRTLKKAEQIAHDVMEGTGYQNIFAIDIDKAGEIEGEGYLALQATKVGLLNDRESSPVTDRRFFEKLSYVYDFIYNPARTKFMQLAIEQGVPSYNGLKMLLYQGIESFKLWSQVEISNDVINLAYEKLIKELYSNE